MTQLLRPPDAQAADLRALHAAIVQIAAARPRASFLSPDEITAFVERLTDAILEGLEDNLPEEPA